MEDAATASLIADNKLKRPWLRIRDAQLVLQANFAVKFFRGQEVLFIAKM